MDAQRDSGGSELPLADRARLGALLVELEPRLHRVALRITGDPETARDVVQSAFEKVVRHGATFRGGARVSTWIHRIVANEALMWLRSERRRARFALPLLDDGPLADPAPGPAELLEQRSLRTQLRAGLARLAASEREVVLRCALAGWSYAEYGRRRGAHPAAVKSRAYRARCRLRALLADAGPGAS